MKQETTFNIQEALKKLPDQPGVYIMKDKLGDVIYVGKAINLKNRVRQYFQVSSNHSPKVKAMVPRIAEFEYIVTDNELEALILECNLIKKYRPKFNILLKDDKSYPYIKVTMNEQYPRIVMTRRFEKDGAKYFGPYTSAQAVKETIELLNKLFPVKSCNKVLPRDVGKGRPCLNYHIYQCMAPCQGGVNEEEYRTLMKDICSFLGGRQDDILKRLEGQMHAAAESMDFERAAALRDKINSVKRIAEKQKVLSTAMEDQDVIGIAKGPADACIQVFFIRGGKLIGREHFIFEGVAETDEHELMTSFVKQFYSSAAFIPGEVVLQEDIDEIHIIERWMRDKRDGKVTLKVPRRGDKQQLVEMVSQNAWVALKQFQEQLQKKGSVAEEGMKGLARLLELKEIPGRIEAYDISNTGTSEMVASMVVFNCGLPDTAEYRRFKIKSLKGQNDYAAMQEVLFRRFRHAEKERLEMQAEEKGGRGKFTELPDLIFVDGGLGHVNAALEVLREMDISLPVYGMVKNESHRTRGLVSSSGEFDLQKNPPVLRLVTAIQDEAHRFAVEYNRKLRTKRYAESALDAIEGIGPARKKALLKHFGSVSKIRRAGIDDLTAVEGISRAVAEKIYLYFQNG